jgi:tetratricopeptide (TPR) repeat protein
MFINLNSPNNNFKQCKTLFSGKKELAHKKSSESIPENWYDNLSGSDTASIKSTKEKQVPHGSSPKGANNKSRSSSPKWAVVTRNKTKKDAATPPLPKAVPKGRSHIREGSTDKAKPFSYSQALTGNIDSSTSETKSPLKQARGTVENAPIERLENPWQRQTITAKKTNSPALSRSSSIESFDSTLDTPTFNHDPRAKKAWMNLDVRTMKELKAKVKTAKSYNPNLYDLANGLRHHHQKNYIPVARTIYKKLTTFTTGASTRAPVSFAYLNLAKIADRKNNPVKAEELAKKSLEVSNGNEQAKIWLASLLFRNAGSRGAMEARALYSELGKSKNTTTLSETEYGLGNIAPDEESKKQHYLKAYEYALKNPDFPRPQAQALVGLGNLSKGDEAYKHYDLAFKLARNIKDYPLQVQALIGRGNVSREDDIETFVEAHRINNAVMKRHDFSVRADLGLGNAYSARGENERASQYYSKAAETAQRHGLQEYLPQIKSAQDRAMHFLR